MTKANSIRRRPDGSIDVDFYMTEARRHRSEAAHNSAKVATRQSGKLLVILATFGLSTVFRGGQV